MIGSALAADAERWMEAEWLQTSGEVRTLLLLAGWAMLTASIQAQMLTRRTVVFSAWLQSAIYSDFNGATAST